MKTRYIATLLLGLFLVSTAFADFVEAIQGTVEKSDSGQIYIKTEKNKYLVVEDFSQPEDPPKPGLAEMAGKRVLVTGVLVFGDEGVRALKVSTFSELANTNLPGLVKWPTVK